MHQISIAYQHNCFLGEGKTWVAPITVLHSWFIPNCYCYHDPLPPHTLHRSDGRTSLLPRTAGSKLDKVCHNQESPLYKTY